ncbi:hypothetical protein ACS0TY_034635 [Phlomoides rotata]
MVNTRKKPDLTQEERNMIAQFLISNNINEVVFPGKIIDAARLWGVCRKIIHYIWAAAKQQRLVGVPALFK